MSSCRTAYSRRRRQPHAPNSGDYQHLIVWTSRRSPSTWRCGSWPGYVAVGFSMTSRASRPWTLRRQEAPLSDGHAAPPAPSRAKQRGGHTRGFDLHAGVVASASDRDGRERLLRYCARPPLSLERLSVLSDGRIAYAIRKPWGNETHRVMSPLQFLARLAALIPPPRHPLIRFYGVFAPNSSWREKVVAVRSPCCRERDEDGLCSAEVTTVDTANGTTTAVDTAAVRIAKRSTESILTRAASQLRGAWPPWLQGTPRLPSFASHRHALIGRSC